jgi:hypothetical protein
MPYWEILTGLLTFKKKPQIEGEKITNQQDHEGKNPKKSVF